MIEKDALELYKEIYMYWWCAIKIEDKLVGFICIMAVKQKGIVLFEPGSLFVKKEYRNKWLWQKLKAALLQKYPTLPMYSVTNVEAVKKINKHLWQHEYTKETIQKELLEIIEIPWKLLVDDVIYCNDILHVLIQKHDQKLYTIQQ
jgi:GNAT superfamily N-acetyltransferase